MDRVLKNILVKIFLIVLCFSCKGGYKTIYEKELNKLDTNINEQIRDNTDCRMSLCVIFEKSVVYKKINIESWSIQEIIFSNNQNKNIDDRIGFICSLQNNAPNYFIYINKSKFYVAPEIYKKYRYLIVSEDNSKLIFRYTNDYYYEFQWLCDNAIFHY